MDQSLSDSCIYKISRVLADDIGASDKKYEIYGGLKLPLSGLEALIRKLMYDSAYSEYSFFVDVLSRFRSKHGSKGTVMKLKNVFRKLELEGVVEYIEQKFQVGCEPGTDEEEQEISDLEEDSGILEQDGFDANTAETETFAYTDPDFENGVQLANVEFEDVQENDTLELDENPENNEEHWADEGLEPEEHAEDEGESPEVEVANDNDEEVENPEDNNAENGAKVASG